MILRIVSFAILALVASVATAQQPFSPPPLISTSGNAVIRVVPDLVDIRFEVEIRNADLTLARQQQSERTIKVLAALRAAGVAETDLQSSHIQISPNYTENRVETEKDFVAPSVGTSVPKARMRSARISRVSNRAS